MKLEDWEEKLEGTKAYRVLADTKFGKSLCHNLKKFISREISSQRKKTPVEEAILKLAQIADFNYYNPDIRKSAGFLLMQYNEEQRSKYIRQLEVKNKELSDLLTLQVEDKAINKIKES